MTRGRSEAGFSLTELLVVVAILGVSMAAVGVVYQVTQRSTLYATAGEDAQLSARSVLDRLVGDLRVINAGRSVSTGAITAASATGITFLADIDADTLDASRNDATLSTAVSAGATTVQVSSATGFSVGELLSIADGPVSETQTITAISGTTLTLGAGLATSYPVGAIVRSVETVTYTYTASGSAGTLTRTVGGTTDTLADNLSAVQFTYWNGSIPPTQIADVSTQANRDSIREIRVEITGISQGGDQNVRRSMASTARPRNLN